MPSLCGLKSMGFNRLSKRFDLRSLNLRMAKTRMAPAPTTDATTMMAIKAVLLSPPDFSSVLLLEAATEAVELLEAVRVVVTYESRCCEVRTRVATEVGETDRVSGALLMLDGVADDEGTLMGVSVVEMMVSASWELVDDCSTTDGSAADVVDADEVVGCSVDEDVCAELGVTMSPALPDSAADEVDTSEVVGVAAPCVSISASFDGIAPMVSFEMAPPARCSRMCLLPKGALPRCR